jgi:pyridoxal phosphate enzyme (YggS family)
VGVAEVRARIAAACDRVGRPASSVQLVAVTKYVSVQQAADVLAAGVVDLGENRAQQLRDRADDQRLVGARWHAVGPLQTNKARYVARWASVFHALDRAEVAVALADRREPAAEPLECYIQVNVAAEPTKAGVAPAEVDALLDGCAGLAGIRVAGLMAMPPLASHPEESRRWFRALRSLGDEHGLRGLSMGTSADFEVAVEEGATVVRVGSALFAPAP